MYFTNTYVGVIVEYLRCLITNYKIQEIIFIDFKLKKIGIEMNMKFQFHKIT